jgi:anthranilate synthase component 2
MTAVTLIDNYDSFTWNLVHYLGSLGADVTVLRNDEASVAQIMDSRPEAIVLSPGPCTPREAGVCLDLIAAAARDIPIFGVCLGHQSIGEAFGGQVVRAPLPVHGKLASIGHEGKTIFAGIETPFQATRYHSLVIDRASMPDVLEAVAKSDDGLVMAVSHRSLPVHGVQFHPESILSQHGHRILGNFLDIARVFNRARVHA